MARMRIVNMACRAIAMVLLWTSYALAAPTENQVVPIFDGALIEWDKGLASGTQRDELKVYHEGQTVERHLSLPPQPANQREAMRITATLLLEPVVYEEDGKIKPGDPWTRLGHITIAREVDGKPQSIEIMRFITGFGGPATFTQDLTALAPLLHGDVTMRLHISTYKKPGWKATLTLTYTPGEAGYRRPVWAAHVTNEQNVTAESSKIAALVDVPAGLSRPRLRILATGHATDGTGGDEFVTRTIILRVDGREIARWRPWAEDAGALREENPMSGRMMIDGRELWSSDLDRSGWRPGAVVEPLIIPAAELSPGRHNVEIEVLNIRPKDQFKHHGYWRISCIAVADEPWPEHPEPKKE